MRKKGFTLTEVLIACGILSMFIGGIIALYSSGSKMSNSAMWLQNVNNQLRTAARQINTSINRSSYPSAVVFPKDVIESQEECFHIKFYKGKLEASKSSNGKNFLVATEAKPAKSGSGINSKENDHDGELLYHVFSLNSKGELFYTSFTDTYKASGFTDKFTKAVPSGTQKHKTRLVWDVDSIDCKSSDDKREMSPIEITINCVMPKNKATKRSETAVGTPNVKYKATTTL